MNVLIVGDYCPAYGNHRLSKEQVFGNFLEVIENADFSIVNLECPITETTKPILKIGPALKAPTEALSIIESAGFSAVTLANNHIADYGEKGLMDTIQHLNSVGIQYVGAGKNMDESRQPLHINIDNNQLQILNVTENEFTSAMEDRAGANGLNPIAIYNQIKHSNEANIPCIVIYHGGHEMLNIPSPRIVELFRFWIDNGAQAVVCHHTHVASGYEIYKEKPIFYSLGNFLFPWYTPKESPWYLGYGVELSFNNNTLNSFKILPFKQSNQEMKLSRLSEQDMVSFTDYIKKLNSLISDNKLLRLQYEKWLSTKKQWSYLLFHEPSRIKRYLIRKGIIKQSIQPQNLALMNAVSCESLRDEFLFYNVSILTK